MMQLLKSAAVLGISFTVMDSPVSPLQASSLRDKIMATNLFEGIEPTSSTMGGGSSYSWKAIREQQSGLWMKNYQESANSPPASRPKSSLIPPFPSAHRETETMTHLSTIPLRLLPGMPFTWLCQSLHPEPNHQQPEAPHRPLLGVAEEGEEQVLPTPPTTPKPPPTQNWPSP